MRRLKPPDMGLNRLKFLIKNQHKLGQEKVCKSLLTDSNSITDISCCRVKPETLPLRDQVRIARLTDTLLERCENDLLIED